MHAKVEPMHLSVCRGTCLLAEFYTVNLLIRYLLIPSQNELYCQVCLHIRGICFRLFIEWAMHGQPPPPPPEQAWIPPGQGPMDVVNPSEDSNSQDSLEFSGDPHRGGFPQNSHGFGGQPEPYTLGPVGVNQFDYQVRILESGLSKCIPSLLTSQF